MLSNICLRNKNQRSFLQLKCRFKFMFGFMFELYPKRDSLGLSKKPNVLPAKIQKMKMVASLINFSYYLTYIPLCGLYTKDIWGRYIYSNTQPVQTVFLFKSIWIRPQRSQGCQKMCQDPLNMPFEVWCANIAPERHKLWKTVKIGKKCQKTPVFIDFFKYSSIWGQY